MSTIPGPIVSFQWDGAQMRAQFDRDLKQFQQSFQRQSKQITDKFATDLSQAVVKTRAAIAQGHLGLPQIQAEQKKIIALADQEINRLKEKARLTTQELASLKRATLERERATNALTTGSGVGVTAGTQSAIRQMSGEAAKARNAIALLSGAVGAQLPAAMQRAAVQAGVLRTAFALAFDATIVIALSAAIIKLVNDIQLANREAERIVADAQIAALELSAGRTDQFVIRNNQLRLRIATSLASDLTKVELTAAEERREILRDISEAESRAATAVSEDVRKSEERNAEILRRTLPLAEQFAAKERLKIRRQLADELRQIENSTALIGLGRTDTIRERARQQVEALQREIDRGGLTGEEVTNRKARQKSITEQSEREITQVRRDVAVEGNAAVLRAEAAAAFGRERIEREYLVTLSEITQEEIRLGLELPQKRLAAETELNTKLKEFARQQLEETRRISESAAIAILAPGRRAVESLRQEQERLLRDLQEKYDRGEILWADFNARRAAIWAETNAKMLDEFASELEGFFDDLAGGNLGKRIQDNLRKAAIRNLAGALQGLQIGGPLGNILADVLGLPSLAKGGGGGSIFNLPGIRTPGINPNARLPGTTGPVSVPTQNANITAAIASLQSSAINADTKTMQVVAGVVTISSGAGTGGIGAAKFGLGLFGSFFGGRDDEGGLFDGIFRNQPGSGGSGSIARKPGNLIGALTTAAIGALGVLEATKQKSKAAGAGQGALSGFTAGAAIGSIVPGIGTLIGGIIGGISGAIAGAFGAGKSKREIFEERIAKALKRQAVTLPEPQDFRFANLSSFADTFGSTFAETASGGFVASRPGSVTVVHNHNHINAMDAHSFAEFARRNSGAVDGAMSGRARGNSRFLSAARVALEPA